MNKRFDNVDLPDFLQSSPFFIPELHDYKPKRQVSQRPTVKQILKSKPFRIVVYTIFAVVIFLCLRREATKADVWGHLTGPACYYDEPVKPPFHYGNSETDWSRFAYVQYATDEDYLCNSVMMFEALQRLGSKAERVLMYPKDFDLSAKSKNKHTELLLTAKLLYSVKLVPIEVQHNNLAMYWGPNWSDSYTKLLAFNQTYYDRLVVLDSDSTILENIDELFFLPPARVATPRAYWLKNTMSSHMMVITPSTSTFSLVSASIEQAKKKIGTYDMEIINSLFGGDCMRIPHRPYALLTGEFRAEEHGQYMDSETEEWDPDATIMEAKFVHFSDHPLDKPWLATMAEMNRYQPECGWTESSNPDCRGQNIWRDLYLDFKARRNRVCGL